MKNFLLLLFGLFTTLIIAQPTATVNGTSFNSLTDAIAAANGGDTVTINGMFEVTSTVQIDGAVSLAGDDPEEDGIKLASGSTGRVLFYSNTVASDFSVSNLTIADGMATGNGAGILIDKCQGTATLSNLIIEDNEITSGPSNGGGISINSTNVNITDSWIAGNVTDGTGQGAGVHITTNNSATNPTEARTVNIRRTAITGNISNTHAGGLYIYGFGDQMPLNVNIENANITDNFATGNGGSTRIRGGALASNSSVNTVTVNMIYVTSARNDAATSTESDRNNFGVYFTTDGGGGPVFNAYNSIFVGAGTVGNRGINFGSSNTGNIINCVMGGQINLNSADTNVNNITGRTAGQIGLTSSILRSQDGVTPPFLILSAGADTTMDAVDHCTASNIPSGVTIPTVDIRNFNRADGGVSDAGAYEIGATLSANSNSTLTKDVSLEPNPANSSDVVNIRGVDDDIRSISVYKLQGQELERTTENSNQIDTSGLPAGVHILEVKTDNRTYNLKLIIK